MRKLLVVVASVVLCGAGVAFAMTGGCQGPEGRPVTRAPSLYDRVVFIGASASSGYKLGPGVSLASSFEDRLAVEYYAVSNLADGGFYQLPTAKRKEMVEEALKQKPTLVVALDFLFWFAHGFPPTDASRRTEIDEGLGLLSRFTCPVIVGDVPDISAAAKKETRLCLVLPKPETRLWANERIRSWVSMRSLASPTLLIPLADTVAAQLAGRSLLLGGCECSTKGCMQADDLHPTKEGEVLLSRLIEQSLIEGHLARRNDFK